MKQMVKELWLLFLISSLALGVFVYQLNQEVDRRYKEIYTHQHQKEK